MSRIANDKGMIFVAALAIMFTFMTFGFTLAAITRLEMETARNSFRMLKDFYSAESAIAHGMADMINGGSGIVAANDLYTDNAAGDYYTAYDAATKMLTGYSAYLPMTYRQVKAQVNGINRALISGNAFSFILSSGVVNGDVEHGNLTGSNIQAGMSLSGNLIQHEVTIETTIPSPDWSWWGDPLKADHFYSSDVTFNELNPPPDPVSNGVIYVDGDVYIEDENITINGTLVTSGMVHLDNLAQPCNYLTVNPYIENYPAIISGSTILADGMEYANITGLVFAESSIVFNSCSNFSINGGMATRGSLQLLGANSFSITYNPLMDMPHFVINSNKTSVKVAHWIGHGPTP